jgi:hypothetical protein
LKAQLKSGYMTAQQSQFKITYKELSTYQALTMASPVEIKKN